MKNTIFRKSSVERVSSPEQLNDYIKIASPGIWIVIGAILLLVAAGLVWSIFGTIKTKVSVYGYAEGGVIACYLEDASGITEGMEAETESGTYKVLTVAATPVSYDEVKGVYGEGYELHMLAPAAWSYKVEIAAAGIADGVVKLDIVKESVTPLSFVFN